MDVSCLRTYKIALPYDALNLESVLLNFQYGGEIARFPTTDNPDNASAIFNRNTYLVNAKTNLNIRFSEMFTVAFWAKFVSKSFTETLKPNRFMLILEDGTVLTADIPSSITATNWNHYSIVKDAQDLVSMRINGTTVASVTSTSAIDLTGNSFVYIGNENRYMTGHDVIVDDVLMVDAPLWNADFSTLPSDYIDVAQFVRTLYIITSTGQVWGYKKDV